jgi:predicted acylesterase/phospholipase RssA
MSGVLLELGFLQRLRESSLWPRLALIAGTSAGALTGCVAALDKLEELERFLLRLRPEDTFRANRLWRLPLCGTHDYVLPRSVAEQLGEPLALARELAASPVELLVVVTDVTVDGAVLEERRLFERAYSSRSTSPEEMAQAVLASAAISMLVLPQLVGSRVATDGGWVRNYPLGYAYERPEIEQIVGFRYEMEFPVLGSRPLQQAARRLRHLTRLPAGRGITRELEEAAARERRGQPAHIVDLFSRLSRVSTIRNTVLEELLAGWREQSVEELRRLKEDMQRLVDTAGLADDERERIAAAIDKRFDRVVPRITVSASSGPYRLEPGFRKPPPWGLRAKQALIQRGYELTDEQLRAQGVA